MYARSKFALEMKMMDILGRLLNVLSTLYLRLKRSVYVLCPEG